jgi:hypothetical protein
MNSSTNTNSSTNPTPGAAPSATTASTLGGITTSLTGDALEKKARRQMASRSSRCPDELITLVSQLAEQSGGTVAGMPYDAQAAKDGLTQVSSLRTQLSVARQLVQRLEDEVVQTRISVVDPTFAIYAALRRLTKTAKGNALLPAYEQMQLALKNRPRRKRNPAKPKLPGVRALKKAAREAAAAAATNAKASGAAAGTGNAPPVTAGGANPKA